MKLFDADTIHQKEIKTDVCIIGAGPAGIALALKLKNSDLDIVIAESGGLTRSERANKLNSSEIHSNFRYRDGESERNRQVGGTANLWAGRVVPFSFDDRLDEEWEGLKERVVPYYQEAFKIFGINPAIENHKRNKNGSLHAYWADKTERFTYKSKLLNKNKRARIYYNLTCIGDPIFENEKLRQLTFLNQKGKKIKVWANCFVCAMGAIENSRMLLIIKEALPPDQKGKLHNAGKYMMDHPRVWHGDVNLVSKNLSLSKYQIKRNEFGIYKRGIRNKPESSRVYCNLMRERGRLNRLLDFIPSVSFNYSFRKLLMREKGILKGIVNEIIKKPVVIKSQKFRKSLTHYFNDDSSDRYNVMTYCEQRPRKENRITLDDKKDPNGVPIAKLENNIHEEELQEVLNFYGYLNNYFEKRGCEIEYDPNYLFNPANYTDAAHPMGGTRYSKNEDKKVVEQDLSTVGISNLYVSGSSVFPTSSVENPTHLIVALSCYLAEVLKRKFE